VNSMFIAVEGPNGVGKTTVTRLLAGRWAQLTGEPVHATAEPSDSALGRLLRSAEWTLTDRAFALAIAADRYDHLDNEVIPKLDAGVHVFTDRYVPSSLVLQRIDGMEPAEIWRYNAHVLEPTLTVYLSDDPRVIAERVRHRGAQSRLELSGGPERELALYAEARRFLTRGSRAWRHVSVDCRGHEPAAVVEIIVAHLDRLRQEIHTASCSAS
jgi:dTMP kinase